MSAILANRTVIVTGAGGGLGKEVAAAALNAGANVVAVDMNRDLLDACDVELQDGGRLLSLHADVASEEKTQHVFSEAIDRFGHVDALVNNAGIMDRFAAVGDLDMELFDRVMAINVRAPAFLSNLAVQHFLEKKGEEGRSAGNIVNIGSQSSFRGGAAGKSYFTRLFILCALTYKYRAESHD